MSRLLLIAFLTALTIFSRSAKARYVDPTPDQYCFVGCQTTLYTQTFSGAPSALEDPDAEPCQNELHVKTGWSYVNDQCVGYGYPLLSLSIVDNITDTDLQNLPTLEYGDPSVMINTTTLVSEDLFDLGYRTIEVWYRTKDTHLWYSKAMFIFWGVVIALGVCANTLSWMRSGGTVANDISPEGSAIKSTNIIVGMRNLLRSRFLLPATFGNQCEVPVGQVTIPPRAEFTVISIFIIINIVLCAVAYTTFERNLYWADTKTQLWRYLADRTGYLSYANLAIFWAFGIRNNILIFATGWNFPTFTRFHRWVARVATVQAILHAVAYTVESYLSGGFEEYAEEWAYQYWYCGVIAVITMSFVLVFSMLWIRVKYYDVFLLLHIGLALIALVNLFYHTKIFLGEFDWFLWPCVIFWVFDRVCRVARVVYSFARATRAQALAEFSDRDKIIRIDVTDVFSSRNIAGGVNFFLYSPFSLLGWQNHPFTLVRWKEAVCDASPSVTSTDTVDNKGPITTVSRPLNHRSTNETRVRYSFLLRPIKGYTLRLSKSLQSSSSSKPTTFLYEGPYGHVPNLSRFSDILLLVGGSGISVGISCIYNALEDNPDSSIHLVWTCGKSASLIDSVMNKELDFAMESGRLTVDAYATSPSRPSSSSSSSSSSPLQHPTLPEYTSTNFTSYPHRPSISSIVHESMSSTSTSKMNSSRSLAVVVCGPASLNDEARAAFVAELNTSNEKNDNGNMDTELFLEGFNW